MKHKKDLELVLQLAVTMIDKEGRKTVRIAVKLSCSSPNLLGVKRIPRSLLCTTLYSMCERESLLCVWATVSLDSPGNRRPRQTPRADSSIWNPIMGDQEENSSTSLRASSRCWMWPRGKRVCARTKWKIDEWNMICTWFTVHQFFQVTCKDDWFLGRISSISFPFFLFYREYQRFLLQSLRVSAENVSYIHYVIADHWQKGWK